MARIVLTTWGSHGDIDPFLGLGLGLRARGHQVAIATIEYYRPLVETSGLEFRSLRPEVDPNDTALIERIMDRRHGSEPEPQRRAGADPTRGGRGAAAGAEPACRIRLRAGAGRRVSALLAHLGAAVPAGKSAVRRLQRRSEALGCGRRGVSESLV